MTEDIFAFWARCPRGSYFHPDDNAVLSRARHRFELNCLPAPFTGPLRTAKVVLLFLAPGLASDGFDERHAASEAGRDWYARQLGGLEPMPNIEDHAPHYRWWSSKIGQFGLSPKDAANKVAVLDLAPYHSAQFHDWGLLSGLPSCRMAVGWAQNVLFPQAIAGERMVVCLRSPECWGLKRGGSEGVALFSPELTRGGHMLHGKRREQIASYARALCI